eukprot:767556-Hanusia_phi.AAC.5
MRGQCLMIAPASPCRQRRASFNRPPCSPPLRFPPFLLDLAELDLSPSSPLALSSILNCFSQLSKSNP